MNDNSISKEVVDAFNAAMNGRGSPSRNTKQRLIDANQAMRKIREYMEDYPNATARLAACRACLSILGDKQQVPTIDPESLRPRGTWEGTADGYANGELVYDTWTCSECGYTVETDDPDDLTKFCPYCGAKMEGGHNP